MIDIIFAEQGRRNGIESTVSCRYITKKFEVSQVPFSKDFRFQSCYSKIYSVPGYCTVDTVLTLALQNTAFTCHFLKCQKIVEESGLVWLIGYALIILVFLINFSKSF